MTRIFKEIYGFLISMRQTGTSALIRKISKKYDIYVLVPNEKSKESFGDSAISFNDLKNNYRGLPSKPVLADNQTLLSLFEYLSDLEEKISIRNDIINNIDVEIQRFNNISGNAGNYIRSDIKY